MLNSTINTLKNHTRQIKPGHWIITLSDESPSVADIIKTPAGSYCVIQDMSKHDTFSAALTHAIPFYKAAQAVFSVSAMAQAARKAVMFALLGTVSLGGISAYAQTMTVDQASHEVINAEDNYTDAQAQYRDAAYNLGSSVTSSAAEANMIAAGERRAQAYADQRAAVEAQQSSDTHAAQIAAKQAAQDAQTVQDELNDRVHRQQFTQSTVTTGHPRTGHDQSLSAGSIASHPQSVGSKSTHSGAFVSTANPTSVDSVHSTQTQPDSLAQTSTSVARDTTPTSTSSALSSDSVNTHSTSLSATTASSAAVNHASTSAGTTTTTSATSTPSSQAKGQALAQTSTQVSSLHADSTVTNASTISSELSNSSINVGVSHLRANTPVSATINGKTQTITAGELVHLNPHMQVAVKFNSPFAGPIHNGGNNHNDKGGRSHSGNGNGPENAQNSRSAGSFGGGHVGGGRAGGGFHY